MTEPALVILDASAYRHLVRDVDPTALRDLARGLADAGRARGERAVVSPFTLWALLADVAAVVAPSNEKRGASDAEHARSNRARAAIAACVMHCARERGETGKLPFVLTEDPDTRLCRAVGIAPPPGLAAWNEYLASLATDIAADQISSEPGEAAARKLAGPLAHVVERATQASEDAADEVQDAVLAFYESTSADDDADLPLDAAALLNAVRMQDPLLRAVALRRAARAHRFAVGTSPDDAPDPTIDEATRVAEQLPTGVALGRDVLRRVIAGEVEVAGRAARRWLWDLHVAYGLTTERGVAAHEMIVESLGGSVPGIESLAAYRARLGA